MNERRVHIYGSGRGFAVVPVCYHSEKGWVECEPVQEVGLEKGLPIRVIFEQAIERAVQHPCSDLQVWNGTQGGWRNHHLFVARLAWHAGTLQLFILPDTVPAKEWPENVPSEYVVHRLVKQLGIALA